MDSNQLRPTTSRHSLRKTPKVGPAHHNKSYITVVFKQIQMALAYWITAHFQLVTKNYTTSRASST